MGRRAALWPSYASLYPALRMTDLPANAAESLIGVSRPARESALARRRAHGVSVPGPGGGVGDHGAARRVSAEAVSIAGRRRRRVLAADRQRHPAASRARHRAAAVRRLRACRRGRGRGRHPDGPLAPRRGHLPAAGQHHGADPRHRLGAAVPAVVRIGRQAGDAAGRVRLGIPDHLQHLDRREGGEGNLGALGAGDGRRRPRACSSR